MLIEGKLEVVLCLSCFQSWLLSFLLTAHLRLRLWQTYLCCLKALGVSLLIRLTVSLSFPLLLADQMSTTIRLCSSTQMCFCQLLFSCSVCHSFCFSHFIFFFCLSPDRPDCCIDFSSVGQLLLAWV